MDVGGYFDRFDLSDEARADLYYGSATKVSLRGEWGLPQTPLNGGSSLRWIGLVEEFNFVEYNTLWLKAYAVRSLLWVSKWK